MRFLTVALPILVTLTAHAQAPTGAPHPTTQIAVSGQVVAAETGDPVPNVRLRLSRPAAGLPAVLTDGDGHFRLNLPTGVARIVANKTGFAPESALPTMDGEPLKIRLQRAASISGRIVDEFGEPVVDAHVSIEAASTQPQAPRAVKSTETDDHGEYHVGGFRAGTFLVSVTTVDANAIVREHRGGGLEFAPGTLKTYFPGATTVADARPIRLNFGEDRTTIDIVVPGSPRGGQQLGMVSPQPGRTIADHPAFDPAVIRGQVVDSDGRALAHAFVRLSLQGLPGALRAGRADVDGRFEFADLVAGTFRVSAYVPGYAALSGESPVVPAFDLLPSSPSIRLAPAQLRDGLVITLTRLGAIAGRVLDELGDPVEGARVQLLQVKYQAGRRRLVQANEAARLTDDRGEYRLHDLPQGRYIVSAWVGDISTADVPDYTRSYFPGTPNPSDAQFVTLADVDLVSVDVALARTRTALVRGHIFSAAGEPSTGGQVELRPSARSASPAMVPVRARLLPDGVFEFPNVPPGEYVVVAERTRSNPSSEGEYGSTLVNVVDADVTNLIVQMSAGSSIAGRFTFDTNDQTPHPQVGAIALSAVGVDPDQTPSSVASAEITENWTFTMTGINGPRRLDLSRVPAEWMLKEVRARGTDITDRAIMFGRKDQSLTDVEVVLTHRITDLGGRIVDESGRAAGGAHVIVFSTDRARWYPASRFLREVTVGQDGLYRLVGLPSGSYYAASVPRLPVESEEAWQDPEFLDTLAFRATTVMLGEGQREALNLKAVSPR
jgi:protocatechuate 3,4-dioxygenase beta subunit